MTDTTDTTYTTPAQAYHEGYLDGIKVALELVGFSIDYETAKLSLETMIETLNKKKD